MEIGLDKDISSKMYPLTRRWLMVEILKKLSGAFVVVGVVLFENYFGASGFFVQFLLTIDIIVFVLLGLVAAISAIAFRGILQSLQSFLYFEYVVTSTGVEYRTGQEKNISKFLPHENIREVSVKRGVFDRIFGYTTLWLNPPPWRRRLYFSPKGGSSLAIQGLTKNEAEHIADFIREKSLGAILRRPL